MSYNKCIFIQKQNEETELWEDYLALHADVNKLTGTTSAGAGADQYHARLRFKIRYLRALEMIRYEPQLYRIIYRGHHFRITDYDDFMDRHLEVILAGELYE